MPEPVDPDRAVAMDLDDAVPPPERAAASRRGKRRREPEHEQRDRTGAEHGLENARAPGRADRAGAASIDPDDLEQNGEQPERDQIGVQVVGNLVADEREEEDPETGAQGIQRVEPPDVPPPGRRRVGDEPAVHQAEADAGEEIEEPARVEREVELPAVDGVHEGHRGDEHGTDGEDPDRAVLRTARERDAERPEEQEEEQRERKRVGTGLVGQGDEPQQVHLVAEREESENESQRLRARERPARRVRRGDELVRSWLGWLRAPHDREHEDEDSRSEIEGRRRPERDALSEIRQEIEAASDRSDARADGIQDEQDRDQPRLGRAELALTGLRGERQRRAHQDRRRQQQDEGAGRVDQTQRHVRRERDPLRRVEALAEIEGEQEGDPGVDCEQRDLDDPEGAERITNPIRTSTDEARADPEPRQEDEHHDHRADRLAAAEEELQRALPEHLVEDRRDPRQKERRQDELPGAGVAGRGLEVVAHGDCASLDRVAAAPGSGVRRL